MEIGEYQFLRHPPSTDLGGADSVGAAAEREGERVHVPRVRARRRPRRRLRLRRGVPDARRTLPHHEDPRRLCRTGKNQLVFESAFFMNDHQ